MKKGIKEAKYIQTEPDSDTGQESDVPSQVGISRASGKVYTSDAYNVDVPQQLPQHATIKQSLPNEESLQERIDKQNSIIMGRISKFYNSKEYVNPADERPIRPSPTRKVFGPLTVKNKVKKDVKKEESPTKFAKDFLKVQKTKMSPAKVIQSDLSSKKQQIPKNILAKQLKIDTSKLEINHTQKINTERHKKNGMLVIKSLKPSAADIISSCVTVSEKKKGASKSPRKGIKVHNKPKMMTMQKPNDQISNSPQNKGKVFKSIDLNAEDSDMDGIDNEDEPSTIVVNKIKSQKQNPNKFTTKKNFTYRPPPIRNSEKIKTTQQANTPSHLLSRSSIKNYNLNRNQTKPNVVLRTSIKKPIQANKTVANLSHSKSNSLSINQVNSQKVFPQQKLKVSKQPPAKIDNFSSVQKAKTTKNTQLQKNKFATQIKMIEEVTYDPNHTNLDEKGLNSFKNAKMYNSKKNALNDSVQHNLSKNNLKKANTLEIGDGLLDNSPNNQQSKKRKGRIQREGNNQDPVDDRNYYSRNYEEIKSPFEFNKNSFTEEQRYPIDSKLKKALNLTQMPSQSKKTIKYSESNSPFLTQNINQRLSMPLSDKYINVMDQDQCNQSVTVRSPFEQKLAQTNFISVTSMDERIVLPKKIVLPPNRSNLSISTNRLGANSSDKRNPSSRRDRSFTHKIPQSVQLNDQKHQKTHRLDKDYRKTEEDDIKINQPMSQVKSNFSANSGRQSSGAQHRGLSSLKNMRDMRKISKSKLQDLGFQKQGDSFDLQDEKQNNLMGKLQCIQDQINILSEQSVGSNQGSRRRLRSGSFRQQALNPPAEMAQSTSQRNLQPQQQSLNLSNQAQGIPPMHSRANSDIQKTHQKYVAPIDLQFNSTTKKVMIDLSLNPQADPMMIQKMQQDLEIFESRQKRVSQTPVGQGYLGNGTSTPQGQLNPQSREKSKSQNRYIIKHESMTEKLSRELLSRNKLILDDNEIGCSVIDEGNERQSQNQSSTMVEPRRNRYMREENPISKQSNKRIMFSKQNKVKVN